MKWIRQSHDTLLVVGSFTKVRQHQNRRSDRDRNIQTEERERRNNTYKQMINQKKRKKTMESEKKLC